MPLPTDPTTRKTAVDATAEAYWEQYFGPYGKQWVRSIPRRVAFALIPRTAGAQAPAEVNNTAAVYPLAKAVTKEGVRLEGYFQYRQAGQEHVHVFSAAFDHEGRLIEIDSLPAPAGVA